MRGSKVGEATSFAAPEAKDALSSERDGDDGRFGQEMVDAIAVLANVVLPTGVIPVHQQPVQAAIDSLSRPREVRFENRRDRERTVYCACVPIVASVGLLPTRCLNPPAGDSDLVPV